MVNTNVAIAEAYFQALGNKDLSSMEKYLHPDVKLIGPIASWNGKEAVLAAAKRRMPGFNSLSIRNKLGSSDQAILIFDIHFPQPVGTIRTAAHLTLRNSLIFRIELFYDATALRNGS